MEHSHGHEHHNMTTGEGSAIEYAKFAGIIAGITLLALGMQYSFNSHGIHDFLGWFMGVFFVVFASFKFIGYSMFTLMFAGYDVIAKRVKFYAYAYPFIELGLGILYLLDAVPIPRDLATIAVMGIGSIGVYQEIRKRSGIHCACLGNIIKLPLSTVSLVEDVGMSVMAIVMLVISR